MATPVMVAVYVVGKNIFIAETKGAEVTVDRDSGITTLSITPMETADVAKLRADLAVKTSEVGSSQTLIAELRRTIERLEAQVRQGREREEAAATQIRNQIVTIQDLTRQLEEAKKEAVQADDALEDARDQLGTFRSNQAKDALEIGRLKSSRSSARAMTFVSLVFAVVASGFWVWSNVYLEREKEGLITSLTSTQILAESRKAQDASFTPDPLAEVMNEIIRLRSDLREQMRTDQLPKLTDYPIDAPPVAISSLAGITTDDEGRQILVGLGQIGERNRVEMVDVSSGSRVVYDSAENCDASGAATRRFAQAGDVGVVTRVDDSDGDGFLDYIELGKLVCGRG